MKNNENVTITGHTAINQLKCSNCGSSHFRQDDDDTYICNDGDTVEILFGYSKAIVSSTLPTIKFGDKSAIGSGTATTKGTTVHYIYTIKENSDIRSPGDHGVMSMNFTGVSAIDGFGNESDSTTLTTVNSRINSLTSK